ncbi:hypothetical protein BD626DRAFT_480564 [Schizophyllum amplum]|uniref:Cytochrome c oxidase subunit 8, mitochondrial n=1 Tax=Schizophyllum amplum TaxID=97359 RepID=A0A550CT93_9AGAR|nr:hypothetical protein BD626DRAFT_480564 [Auriculariopsis ampla]
MSAVLARSALRAQVLGRSGLHSTAVVRSGKHEVDGSHLPFNSPPWGGSKAGFGTKLGLFMSFGFGLPFIAAAWQRYKAS